MDDIIPLLLLGIYVYMIVENWEKLGRRWGIILSSGALVCAGLYLMLLFGLAKRY